MKINTDLTTSISGFIGAIIIAQQTYYPDLIPLEVIGAIGAALVASSGVATNKDVVSILEPKPKPKALGDERTGFLRCMEFVKRWEGGEVNHKADLGGHTNLGVIQATYDAYRSKKGLARQSVSLLTPLEAEDVYWELYWTEARCGRCEWPLSLAYFDSCVNFGVGGGIRFLQQAIGVAPDGRWGERSEQAFKTANHKQAALRLVNSRIAYRHQRVSENASQRVFLQGWLNRDNDLKRKIEQA